MQLSEDPQLSSFIFSFLQFLPTKHLNLLRRIFFTSGGFQNFEVDFWPLLKTEKVLPPSRFWLENFISYPYESKILSQQDC